MNLMRSNKHKLELPDTTTFRARVVDAADNARDIADKVRGRAGELAESAPSPREAAGRARDSRVGEHVAAGIGVVLPLVPGGIKQLAKYRASKRVSHVARLTPKHPVAIGFVLAVTAAVAAVMWRSKRRAIEARDVASIGAFDLDEEVARMQDEGGDPGAASSRTERRPRRAKTSASDSGATPLSGAR